MDTDVLRKADLIVGLDVREWEKQIVELDSTNRTTTSLVPDDCEMVEMGFAEVGISKWSHEYGRMIPCTVRALGDPEIGIPQLTGICRDRIAGDSALAGRVKDRSAAIAERHGHVWRGWREASRENWDASPIALGRLASEVWEVIRDEDWVLSAGTLRQWARKLWDFDKPYRHPGKALGTSTQIGISIGVALAHKGTGRIVVDMQPDGDLMFDAGALWTAAKYEIPMLIVMFNNRAYYNDWEHQIRMARHRGTDIEKAHIGMDLYGPDPDFAGLARSMGCHGEGPIEDPGDISAALGRAVARVKEGQPALVDVITRKR
jgi:acetolactate synthase-1/2/3 large subunit